MSSYKIWLTFKDSSSSSRQGNTLNKYWKHIGFPTLFVTYFGLG